MLRRVVFLDRDGTINVDYGYVSSLEKWELLPGAPEAIRMLREAGYAMALVTNQSAVAKGLCDISDVVRLHTFMQEQLARQGATIDAIAICPHSSSDQCECRKPRTGLAKQVERTLGQPIDYLNSWTIGDKLSDVEFGRSLGTKTALLTSKYWKAEELRAPTSCVFDSLLQASSFILRSDFLVVPQ